MQVEEKIVDAALVSTPDGEGQEPEKQNFGEKQETEKELKDYPPQQYPPPQQYSSFPPPYPPQPVYPQQVPPYPPQAYPPPPPGYPQDPQVVYSGDAILAGSDPEGQHFVSGFPPVEEPFLHQFRRLPKHFFTALLKPRHYDELVRFASWAMVLFLLFVEIVWQIILSAIHEVLLRNAEDKTSSSDASGSSSHTVSPPSAGALIGTSILGTLFGFIVLNGYFHVASLCFRKYNNSGKASSRLYLELCFVSLLFTLPIDFLQVLTLIPKVGFVFGLGLGIWSFILYVFAMREIYGITICNAICIIILTVVVLAIIVVILFFTIGMAILGVIGLSM